MKALRCAALVAVVLISTPLAAQQHPRLWIRSSDLPELRARAVPSNPLYEEGLRVIAENARDLMDEGIVPSADEGDLTWDQYPSEMYAMLFAFMSLIENDAAVRDDYAERARTVLMHIIDEASGPAVSGEPFRDPDFSSYDRSRWWGEGFGLTVDWIYPTLTAEDKSTIRSVFLRWCDELRVASTTDYNHPEPVGVVNDEALLSDPIRVRWSANNYYLAHMRNLGLMAMSFDPDDDPNGELTGRLSEAIGAWLYVWDHLLRNDARGGFSPEGFLYGPESMGFALHFLYALYTAGEDDASKWGPHAEWWSNPFWNDVIPAYLQSLSPATTVHEEVSWIGEVYEPAWFGDGQEYWLHDAIGFFGPLGLHWEDSGENEKLEAARWIQMHTPPGGEEMLLQRISDTEIFRDAILYFLLFDPAAATPRDPRPSTPRMFEAPGIGRIHARTSWGEDASFFNYYLGWDTVDHQLAEGNQFELYRNGEWLTKGRVGWDGTSELCTIGRSDYHNSLSVENEPGSLFEGHWLELCQQHGSQLIQSTDGDPEIIARSFGSDFVYATGDATNLYNSEQAEMDEVEHVSRSIVWLMPDHIVIFDRARTSIPDRFKRFWLNAPTMPERNGSTTTITTRGGQHLHVQTLLPANPLITAEAGEDLIDVAVAEPMGYRLRVEPSMNASDAEFLHVLQAADPGGAPQPASLVESLEGTNYAGAIFGTTAVLFIRDLETLFTSVTFEIPSSIARVLVTGLTAESGYDISTQPGSAGSNRITITPGTSMTTDAGGTLEIKERPARKRPVRRH